MRVMFEQSMEDDDNLVQSVKDLDVVPRRDDIVQVGGGRYRVMSVVWAIDETPEMPFVIVVMGTM